MRSILKYIFFSLTVALTIVGCSAKKAVTDGITGDASANSDDAKFQTIFFEGQKEKAIENYNKAYQKFQECAQVNPEEDVIYYELARIDTINNNYSSALNNILKASELDPNNLWYSRLLADIQVEIGALDEGLKTLKSIALKAPKDIVYRDKLASLATYQKDYKTALESYNQIEKQVGLNEDLTRQKYYLFMDQGDDDGALNELKKLSLEYPSDINYLRNIAAHHSEMGDQENAQEVYEKILIIDPTDGITQLALAEFYSLKGNTEKSNRALNAGFSDENTPIEPKIKVLFTIIQSNDDSVDVNELIKILQSKHPERGETWSISGDYAEMNSQPAKALEYFKKALAIDPNYKDLWLRINQIAYVSNNYIELRKISSEAMTYFPLEPDFYFFEGHSKLHLDDSQGAISTLLTGKDFILDDPAAENKFQVALGKAYFQAEDYQLAQKWLQTALTTGSVSSGEVMEYLGDTYSLQGKTAEALVQWNKAKDLGGVSNLLDSKIANEQYISE